MSKPVLMVPTPPGMSVFPRPIQWRAFDGSEYLLNNNRNVDEALSREFERLAKMRVNPEQNNVPAFARWLTRRIGWLVSLDALPADRASYYRDVVLGEPAAQAVPQIRWTENEVTPVSRPTQNYVVDGKPVPEARFRQALAEWATNVAKARTDAATMQRAEIQKWVEDGERAITQSAAIGALDLATATFLLDVSRGGTGRAGADEAGPAPVVNVTVPVPEVNITNHVDATPRGDIAFDYDRQGRLAGLTRTPAKS